jgi:AraC-like DNA-binding protein
MKLNPTSRQILEVLQKQMIPWSITGSPFVLLDAPPRVIGTNQVTESPAEALASQHGEGKDMRVQYWYDENLNSMSVPYLCCIVEGEADVVIGTTTSMCRKRKMKPKRWVVQMPKRTFLLLPPGIPISAGRFPHWQRPYPEHAYSRILWMQVHEKGLHCHFSTTSDGKLLTHPYTLISGEQFSPIAYALVNEMFSQSAEFRSIVALNLGLLLHHAVRSLLTTPASRQLPEPELPARPMEMTTPDALTTRAISIIDESIKDTNLTVDKIAKQIHVSSVHLNRIFRSQLKSSVMQFVTRRRLELGCHLLTDSSLNISQIRIFCGYSYSSSFIKAFIRQYGVSPQQYRINNFRNHSDVPNG